MGSTSAIGLVQTSDADASALSFELRISSHLDGLEAAGVDARMQRDERLQHTRGQVETNQQTKRLSRFVPRT